MPDSTTGYENIFRRAVKEFQEADAAAAKAQDDYKARNKSADLFPQVFSLERRRIECGVILLMSAGAFLEQSINDYAYTFLDPESFEEHLGNLRSVTKWMLLPRLCQNKEISEEAHAINALREFTKARNAIVHNKRKELDLRTSRKNSTERERFFSACRKAESTVEALVKILTSPPPPKK